MKKIQIICPYIEGLTTIKSYLAELNCEITDFKSIDAALKSTEVPDLFIFFAEIESADYSKDTELMSTSAAHARIPRIVILPSNFPPSVEAPDTISGQAVFRMPVDKLRLLSVVAMFLKRAQRRIFKILVTLQPEGSNIRYTGISMDFSESGMAFECVTDFAKGEKITLHFVNPRSRKRFLLKSEIARKAKSPTSDNIFYGVKFLNTTRDEKKDLASFITGEE